MIETTVHRIHPDPMSLHDFHPAVAAWFGTTFPAPTPAQVAAWPAIRAGQHTLVAAPTGSGKTLTAFLAAIDALIREGLAHGGELPDETAVVYVSPLKALTNDIHVNLEAPLEGIRAELQRQGLPEVDIRTAVRTGDTPQSERTRMRKRPPHIVVTTPESLYVLLGSESGRAMLATTRTVIVDEIHAIAGSKRGSHLSLTLERLESLCQRRLLRIGLSATQKPIDEVARFLTGAGRVAALAALTPPPAGWGRLGGGEAFAVVPEQSQIKSLTPPSQGDFLRSQPSPAPQALPSVASRGGSQDCTIIDVGYTRQRDLALEVPPLPLEAVMSGDAWGLVYQRIAELVEQHRTTLVFVNTRRMAERAARQLSERLGKEVVAAHHGSLSKEHRLDAERRLKRGELRVLVATASLELGIDIGDVDLVCQLGSPHSIAAFLQRVGRSGHAVGATPKGRLFPSTLDDLVECAALLDAVRRDELDALVIPPAPLDVLAQQLVAELACQEWDEDALFALVRRAYPYQLLTRVDFDVVLRMLAEGFSTQRGMRAAYVHRDAVQHRLRGRRNARLTALTSGGTIPDTADYLVVMEPQAQIIGSVHEDFAVESLAGDIFQLGNQSYRILRVERDRLRVEDAKGAPPSIPFWLGEAPGRSDELSAAVARLRGEVSQFLDVEVGAQSGSDTIAVESSSVERGENEVRGETQCCASPVPSPAPAEHPLTREGTPYGSPGGEGKGVAGAMGWLVQEVGLDDAAARQVVEYLAGAKAVLGVLPTLDTLAMERFFDESGGMQLVIHTPYGSRINRAWGLALRKRFCRSFNFELQAAATEDAIVLSLSTSHSFPLAEVAQYLHSNTAEHVLTQALLDAPLFPVRWRWAATTALALPRYSGGKKVPPQIQRMKSEDLLASVFPDQVACLENIVGERQIPDHPLVRQTLHDCLREAMDIDGLLKVLRGLESGAIRMVARDLPAPSPLAAGVLNAAPYAFLDDAPLEERRTQAVQSRRWHTPDSADDLGALDVEAIDAVRAEAWPQARDTDEMHEALMLLGFVSVDEARQNEDWPNLLSALVKQHRATRLQMHTVDGPASAPSPPLGGEGGDEGERAQRAASGTETTVARGDSPSSACGLFSPDRGRREENAEALENPTIWIAAERLPMWQTLHPNASMQPAIAAPAEYAAQTWTREAALVELLRARLSGLGPTTVDALAESFAVPASDIVIALAALQREGYVMEGRFTGAADEWCQRYLLARIHRYTLGRLRREIKPVERRDFMRFAFDWQRVAHDTQVSGPEALAGVLAQLEGFEAPAAAWEAEILPARVADYSIGWLDDLCRAGRVVWTRLSAGAHDASKPRSTGPLRSTPIALLPRRSLSTWTGLASHAAGEVVLSSRAQAVIEVLREYGASFFDELMTHAHLLRSELEDALGELVAVGAINADSFAGLRALLMPAAKRARHSQRRLRRNTLTGIEDAGRWSPVRRPSDADASHPDDATLEHVARTLLRRYGVVCWRLLEREASWLPPWRDLRRVYHRLEARGDIRGGRFVEGLVGEQFALPEAVELLRQVRKRDRDGTLVCVCGADPLNLVGTVLGGSKVPALTGSRILYRDGVAIAAWIAGKMTALIELDPEETQMAKHALLRHAMPHAVPATLSS